MAEERSLPTAAYFPIKVVSYVALAAMAGAITYIAWISVINWSGISV